MARVLYCVCHISVLSREEEKGAGKPTAGSHSFPLLTVNLSECLSFLT